MIPGRRARSPKTLGSTRVGRQTKRKSFGSPRTGTPGRGAGGEGHRSLASFIALFLLNSIQTIDSEEDARWFAKPPSPPSPSPPEYVGRGERSLLVFLGF